MRDRFPRGRSGRRWALALLLLTPTIGWAQKAPPGFKSELLFKTPEIEHPSAVTCDDDGNLFVGEDPMDMRGPSTKELDRIQFVRFDSKGGPPKKTVFCKGLSAVFGLQWYDGWLYVMHAPHYSRFRDADGDGVAEIREDLAEGFGPPAGVFGFNDHIVSGIRLGMDGWMYVSVGDKGIQKAVGKDKSTITLEGGGVVRMRPDGTKLEIFSSGTRNHLDVAMNDRDDIFTYDNTDDGLGWWTRFTHHIQGGCYGYPFDYLHHSERHLPRISEHGGGSPCGGACYNEAAWPKKYHGAPFFCEWGKGKVQCFHVKPKGASFTAEIEDFLIREGEGEFRPVDLCFSPDGKSMYVADWNHAGWLTPTLAGRVYRVSYVGKGSTTEPPPAKDSDAVDAQLKSLNHPSFSERLRAQHSLIRLGLPAKAPLRAVLRGANPPPKKIHALWALVEIARREGDFSFPPAIGLLLLDSTGEVRAQALRALAGCAPSKANQAFLDASIQNADPRVRLFAVLASRASDPNNSPGWSGHSETDLGSIHDPDPTVAFARMQYIRTFHAWSLIEDEWLKSRLQRRTRWAPNSPELVALTGQYDIRAVRILASLGAGAPSAAERIEALQALAEVHRKSAPYTTGWWGTQPAKGAPSRSKVIDWEGTPYVIGAIANALTTPERSVRIAAVKLLRDVPAPDRRGAVRRLVERDSDHEVRREAIVTLGVLADLPSAAMLQQIANDWSAAEDLRGEAIRALASIAAPDVAETIGMLLRDRRNSVALCAVALDSLSLLKDKASESVQRTVAGRLADSRPALRAKAVAAYVKIRGKEALNELTPLLHDPAVEVRKAVLLALAELKDSNAAPALLTVVNDAELHSEAVLALAAGPDRRGLAVYLSGLVDKSPDVRKACKSALATIREQIGPDVVQLYRRNELPAPVRTELQSVFATPASIPVWQVAGSWPKGRRPELNSQQAPNLQEKFQVEHRLFGWKAVQPIDAEGQVDLRRECANPDNAWAVAYAPIQSSNDTIVQAQIGSDDQLQLFLNGRKVYAFDGNRGWAPDQEIVPLTLHKGVNHLWALVGNDSGPWAFSVRVALRDPKFAFLFDATPRKLEPAAFADFARKHKGDAPRGAKIFADPKGVGCIKCHTIAAGGGIGPNLAGIGAKYPREEIARSILEPSNRILSGYQMTQFLIKDGSTLAGIVKRENEKELEIVTSEAKTLKVPAADVEARKLSNLSLMPAGLSEGMTVQDFADLVGYLESLKETPTGKK